MLRMTHVDGNDKDKDEVEDDYDYDGEYDDNGKDKDGDDDDDGRRTQTTTDELHRSFILNVDPFFLNVNPIRLATKSTCRSSFRRPLKSIICG